MVAKLLLAAAAFAAVLSQASAAAIEEDEGVLVLDDDNFDEAVKKYNPLLVEFYAPWCGHCKRLAPEYARAAQILAKDNLFIAKLDATVNKEAASRFGIQGFPTLKFFRGDVSSAAEYNGGRETDAIVSWMRKKAGPSTVTLATAEDAAAFQAKHEVAIVGFFAAGSAAEKAFAAAGNKAEEIPFASSTSDAVRAKFGVAAGAEAVVQVNSWAGEDNLVAFGGSASDADAISAFVDANSLPSVVAFTQESAPKIFRGPIKTHFLVFTDDKAEGHAALVADVRTVSKANKGRALFVTVDPSQDRVVSYFGVTPADFPTAVMVNMPDNEAMKKFVYPKEAKGPLTADSMEAFVREYLAGSLKPFLKSEPAPEGQEKAPVKTVVGTNFESVVLDSTKDVLLEFYAPWCGHCKSLAPEWEKLGQRFQDAGAAAASVVIAKIDATANEVEYPGVNVKGFPTILFFPASPDGSPKKAVEYDGGRDAEGFVDFLRKNAVVPFTLMEEAELDL